ncbi:hypothetical protein RhiirA5_376240 [Rhizophagus irregularis]|uniref:Crinkler effector protein N-terminal domain-containing protein n=1 Tax=Rhizophagus irregularis TaxID=588596 RepID=A0A2N0PNS8_9GLOM|nr:hypothetical protein RhiirA5_376240 [Rhizophagus irregularis]
MVFCFVIGNSVDTAFEVIEDEKTTISRLKEIIFGKNQKCFSDIDANKLRLWRVNIPWDSDDKLGKLELLRTRSSNEDIIIQELGGELLYPNMDIDNIFMQDSKDIQIIVQLPSLPATTGKRKMVEDEEDEFQAKKEKLKRIRFHIPAGILRGSLEMHQQDEEKFRNLVNSLPNINIQDKVFKIPRLPGDNEDTYIYNRECYKYLCNFILEDTKFRRYLITGNPGIGKTFFGRLMLIELLKRNKSVLLDCETFTVWIHPTGKIYTIVNKTLYRQMAEQPNVWCIIDGKKDQVGHDFSNGKLIMVSSPKKAIVRDFAKQWCKSLYMPTWNENELEECWNNLYRKSGKFTLKSVKDKFKLCGGIAQWIFNDNQSLSDIDSVIKQALISVELNMLYNQAKDFSDDEYTYKLIHINTNIKRTDEAEPYTEFFYFFASDNVAKRCLKKFKKNYKERLCSFIESTKNIPEMRSLYEQLFELVSHEILRQEGVFPVRKLTDDGKLEPEITITLESLKEIFFNNFSDIKENIR